MLTIKDVERLFRVGPGSRVRLKDHDPSWAGAGEFKELRSDELKARAKAFLAKNLKELAEAQERLYANDVYSVLIVLQAMDAAGKDGTIKHVMSGVNPQGCQVFSFKKPSDEELDHNFLWRYMKRAARARPDRHLQSLVLRGSAGRPRAPGDPRARQKLPPGKRGQTFWQRAATTTSTAFERHLTRNGTLILKFFLNVSKKEQKQRFLERLDDPDEELEVLAGGPEGTGALGRVPGRVPGNASTHQHEVGAVVGDSRRPQMGDAGTGFGRDRAPDRRPWREASDDHPRAEEGAGGRQATTDRRQGGQERVAPA